MILLTFAFLLSGTLAATEVVTLTALMRAGIYLVPLAFLALVLRPDAKDVPFLKVALTLYAANSVASALGSSREVASLLALIPAICLAAHVLRMSDGRPSA